MSDLIASLSCKTGDAVETIDSLPVGIFFFSLNAFSKSLSGQVINGSVGQRF